MKLIKLFLFNVVIAMINVLVFSPGVLAIELSGENIFQTSLGITIILMSIAIFILGNYKIIMSRRKIIKSIDIETSDDCIYALEQNVWKKTFSSDIKVILEQIERIKKKIYTINELLKEKFNTTEISYTKFQCIINDVEALFYINIKSIINKLNIFDEEEYHRLSKHSTHEELSKSYSKEKITIYNEYITFIKDSIDDNEEVLLKLDKLLFELSKLNSLEDGDLEKMMSMKEIDDLINKTKYYKK